jgi:hypothetical protein
MTELVTCSFRAFRPGMGAPVITSLGLPKWRPEAAEWPRCWLLAPTWAQFRMTDPHEFRASYLDRLDRFGVAKVTRTLELIAREQQAETLVLLCHEIAPTGCHRSLAAEFMLTRAGVAVDEVAL